MPRTSNLQSYRFSQITLHWIVDTYAVRACNWHSKLCSLLLLFSLGEVEKEMGDLRVGLKNLKGELEFQKNSQSTNQAERKDKFIPVMTDFVTIATLGFSELEDALTTSKKKV